jgi:hypothetical protein
MTTDQRLDRLVERHEALTESVELIAKEMREMAAKTNATITDLGVGIARLLRVVEMHEHRLDNHDDRLDGLEGNKS